MFPSALRILSRSLCVLATVAVFSTSCSRQPEGERCDYDWAGPTQDCDSGLTCQPCGNLQSSPVDRCCRTDGTYTDPRCAPAAAPNGISCNTRKDATSTGGTTGTAGSATSGGTAGSATSGGTGATAGSGEMSSSGNAGEATAGSGN